MSSKSCGFSIEINSKKHLRDISLSNSGREAVLIEGLLRLGEGLPRRRVRSNVSASHPEAIDAHHRLGFRTLRVVDQMVMELLPRH